MRVEEVECTAMGRNLLEAGNTWEIVGSMKYQYDRR